METYLPRLVDRVLPELLSALPAVSLTGPRACGKTTTALRYAHSVARLNRSGDAVLFQADPETAIARMEEPILLDEWQQVPEILDVVKEQVDSDPAPGRFILAGSVSAVLRSSWAGTGRVTPVPMYPLTMRELLGNAVTSNDSFVDRVKRGTLDRLLPGPDATIADYMAMAADGGMPEAAIRLSGRARKAWLEGYLVELTSRDIASAGGDPDVAKLTAYVAAMATVSGCVVDDSTIFDAARIGRRTASRYEALLQAVFFCDQLPAWWSSRLTRLAALPKRFVLDTAVLMSALSVTGSTVLKDVALLGRVLETFVAMQLRPELAVSEAQPTMHHLRDHGGRHEVDFILDYGTGQLVGLEVKATASPSAADARHLAWLRDNMGEDFLCGVVLHCGKHSFKLSDRIYAAPISTIWAD